MNNRDEIQEYLRRIEMYMPPAWTLKFGEWEKFSMLIEDMQNEYDENEDTIRDMRNDIEDVIDTLEDVETADEENVDIQKALQKLRGLV